MRKKSQKEKELQGTFEPSKEALDGIEYIEYERIPSPPDDWPPNIQQIWRDRCQDLKASGYLIKAFMTPLRRYCYAVYQAERAEAQLSSGGFVVIIYNDSGSYEKPSPWLQVLDMANKTIERIGAKFGFSPLDAAKIPAIKKDQKTIEENLFD